MTKSMTSRQVNKLVQIVRAAAKSASASIEADAVAFVLEDSDLGATMLSIFQKRVKARTGLRTLTLAEPFDFDSIDIETVKKLGRTLYGDADILLTCPKPVGIQEVSITLWKEEGSPSCQTLDDRYTEKGLAPNPWHLLAFAFKQPDFGDKRAIATQWKDVDGKFCCAAFFSWYGKRHVRVIQNDSDWYTDWWFAGFRK